LLQPVEEHFVERFAAVGRGFAVQAFVFAGKPEFFDDDRLFEAFGYGYMVFDIFRCFPDRDRQRGFLVL